VLVDVLVGARISYFVGWAEGREKIMTRTTGHIFPFLLASHLCKNPMDMDPFLKGFVLSYYFCQVVQSVRVKQKPAVGQPLNLKTLPRARLQREITVKIHHHHLRMLANKSDKWGSVKC
jgi:hypothetical protein